MNELTPLIDVALRRLPKMYEVDEELFAHKTTRLGTQYINVGTNVLYSAIVMIGLSSHRNTRAAFSEASRVVAKVGRAALTSSDASLIGAASWMFAILNDSAALEVLRGAELRTQPKEISSMGLGLLLAGISAAAKAFPERRRGLEEMARGCALELEHRLATRAELFRATHGVTLRAGWVTSFASQVYPLHGLQMYAEAFGLPLQRCVAIVANKLVRLQGALGQWWWLYSARSGVVLEGYPVYSVHQDGMAYMALAPLQNSGHGQFAESLSKGLRWLEPENELSMGIVDSTDAFIARCIQRRGSDPDAQWGMDADRRWRAVAASAGFTSPSVAAKVSELEVLTECRPYHLGWLLYASTLTETW